MKKKSAPLNLGEKPLSLEDVEAVVFKFRPVKLSSRSQKLIEQSRNVVEEKIKSDTLFYGINTGFGSLASRAIDVSEIDQLQLNLLRSHAVGVGPHLSQFLVRAMLLLRAQSLALGFSGVRVEIIERLLFFLNKNICPVVPAQGSVGASGDLAPLAHLALPLIGEGEVFFRSERVRATIVQRKLGLKKIKLKAKEGLALINGTQFMCAFAALDLIEAKRLSDLADWVGALSLEALRGSISPFDARIHSVRPHAGQVLVAKRLREILTPKGKKSEIAKSHSSCTRVQDPYSFRCMPQVHGATRDVLGYVEKVVITEINSVTDNPLIFSDPKDIVSGGNFHGQPLAIALDMLAIAIAELGSISQERLSRLVNPVTSELPAYLTPKEGINSGFMIVQVSAAALVSENKTLCHSATVDTIPTSADKEDHVSMGAWGARKCHQVLKNTKNILGFELMAGAQGLEFLRPLKSSPPIEKLHRLVRKKIKKLTEDRYLKEDLNHMERWVQDWVQGEILI